MNKNNILSNDVLKTIVREEILKKMAEDKITPDDFGLLIIKIFTEGIITGFQAGLGGNNCVHGDKQKECDRQ